jgi:2-succinyl-5-enolpyruvyl-6-hydroxy-3-cyclohexene-1-carboxylate synthase
MVFWSATKLPFVRMSERDESIGRANLAWGRMAAEVLSRCGVERVVLSPGSRSTPLALGFAQCAALEVTPVLDERSAGFLALGMAKESGKPVVLLCTSGTAAANYLPAIVEANLSDVPLVVLTADRPGELRDCQSGQTIDQTKLYGDHVRWWAEVGPAEEGEESLGWLRQTLAQAVRRAVGSPAGPVHLNFPLREPFFPNGDYDEPDLEPLLAQCAPPVRVVPSLAAGEADRLAKELDLSGRRWLVVAGPHAPGDAESHCSAVASIAERLQAPVLADTLSGLRDYAPSNPRLVTTYDAILRSETDLDELAPDAVLSLGPLPTSKTLRKWLGKLDLPTWVVDPSGRDVDGLRGRTNHLTLTAEGFASALATCEGQGIDWGAAWMEREAKVSASLDEKLSETPFAFEGRVAWTLSRCLPAGVPLFAASSMPVRDLEYFWRPNAAGRRIFFNRGANGIDGTLSTALGVAWGGSPAVLLTGDLALLHDANGFLTLPKFKGSLTIALVNNGGGGIFETLPVAQREPAIFEEYFATPQTVGFADLAACHGVQHLKPSSWEEFEAIMSELPAAGVRIVELSTDRKQDVSLRADLLAAAGAVT